MRHWPTAAGWFLLIGLLISAAGCISNRACTGGAQMSDKPGPFVHCVFFTCKPATTAEAIDQQITDAYDLLGKVPSVRRIDSGRRDERMQRDVNDKEFIIGLNVYFDDKAGHDIYADHPEHMKYIERNKANWQSVRVFDFISERCQ